MLAEGKTKSKKDASASMDDKMFRNDGARDQWPRGYHGDGRGSRDLTTAAAVAIVRPYV